MHLSLLRLSHLRNFEQAVLNPSPSLNIIYGQNGAGKSSLLEAIHVLGFGRSFRTSRQNSLISHHQNQAVIFCSLVDTQGGMTKIGCSRSKLDGFTFSVDGDKSVKLAEMVRRVPMQIFTPQSSDLIIGGPLTRRRFVDWALFHVEHQFSQISSSYTKALSQRNALLRQYQSSANTDREELVYWTNALARLGELISSYRMAYVSALNSEVIAIYREFMPEFKIKLSYNAGWDKASPLLSALGERELRDIQLGHSSQGPHKADIKITVNGFAASEMLSRGQLRILVSVMQIAQMRLMSDLHGKSTIYLVDDIAAELDLKTREYFLDLILATNTQVFVTAIEPSQFDFTHKYNDKKVFHVEHNQVKEE